MATQAKTQGTVGAAPTVSDKISAVESSVGAAFIASGIGSLVLGIVIVLTEMKSMAAFKSSLVFVGPVGPLSGKTTLSVLAFLISWVVLHFGLKGRNVTLMTSFIITVVLTVLGMLLSYPPVFELFAK
jgi:energy-converting hydrogenase Eha subunit A